MLNERAARLFGQQFDQRISLGFINFHEFKLNSTGETRSPEIASNSGHSSASRQALILASSPSHLTDADRPSDHDSALPQESPQCAHHIISRRLFR